MHFVALAPVWKDWTIAVPGALLALLGVAGFALAGTSALAWVPIVSGVASGVVLLAASLTTGWRTMAGLSAARA
ncbi:hypothetical protein GCM10020001_040630 [Nonomuraea salmonea]